MGGMPAGTPAWGAPPPAAAPAAGAYAPPPPWATPGGAPAAAAPAPAAPADARVAALEARCDGLQRDLDAIALFAQTLLTMLVEKQVVSEAQFQETKQKLDMLDGKLDNRIGS